MGYKNEWARKLFTLLQNCRVYQKQTVHAKEILNYKNFNNTAILIFPKEKLYQCWQQVLIQHICWLDFVSFH